MIKFYGYKKCSTCAKAEKILGGLNQQYQYIDVTENPPSTSQLKQIFKIAGILPRQAFNTHGILYKELNLKEKVDSMQDNDIIDMMAMQGRLIKRPLITDGTRASIGFKEEDFKKLWKKT